MILEILVFILCITQAISFYWINILLNKLMSRNYQDYMYGDAYKKQQSSSKMHNEGLKIRDDSDEAEDLGVLGGIV